MKAVELTGYGQPLEVLQIREVAKPAPGDDQVLVRVYAASVNTTDLAPIRGALLARLLGTGLRKPKRTRLGTDLAGRVEAVGKSVDRFQPGDEVFGAANGSFAEYVCARPDLLVPKPAAVTFEAAAAVPVAGITVLQGLRWAKIQPGQKVLVNGASGGVGTFAVLIAKSFGTEVTAVCSTPNLENARSLGAEHVIDYTRVDFTRAGEQYDLIISANGYHSIPAYLRALGPQGVCVIAGGEVSQIAQALLFGRLFSRSAGKRIGFMGIAKLNQEDLAFLGNLLEAGKISPLIDRRYPFDEAPRAVAYLNERHARGKVVITMQPDGG